MVPVPRATGVNLPGQTAWSCLFLCRDADEDAQGRMKVQERFEVHKVEMPSQVNIISYLNA